MKFSDGFLLFFSIALQFRASIHGRALAYVGLHFVSFYDFLYAFCLLRLTIAVSVVCIHLCALIFSSSEVEFISFRYLIYFLLLTLLYSLDTLAFFLFFSLFYGLYNMCYLHRLTNVHSLGKPSPYKFTDMLCCKNIV